VWRHFFPRLGLLPSMTPQIPSRRLIAFLVAVVMPSFASFGNLPVKTSSLPPTKSNFSRVFNQPLLLVFLLRDFKSRGLASEDPFTPLSQFPLLPPSLLSRSSERSRRLPQLVSFLFQNGSGGGEFPPLIARVAANWLFLFFCGGVVFFWLGWLCFGGRSIFSLLLLTSLLATLSLRRVRFPPVALLPRDEPLSVRLRLPFAPFSCR